MDDSIQPKLVKTCFEFSDWRFGEEKVYAVDFVPLVNLSVDSLTL